MADNLIVWKKINIIDEQNNIIYDNYEISNEKKVRNYNTKNTINTFNNGKVNLCIKINNKSYMKTMSVNHLYNNAFLD
jgi:hypothetical protein